MGKRQEARGIEDLGMGIEPQRAQRCGLGKSKDERDSKSRQKNNKKHLIM